MAAPLWADPPDDPLIGAAHVARESVRAVRPDLGKRPPAPARASMSGRGGGLNRVHAVITGDEQFVEEAVSFILRQKREILLSNFHVTAQGAGERVVEALTRQLEAGTRVKVLVDGTEGVFKRLFMRKYRRRESIGRMRDHGIEVLEYRGAGSVKHNHSKYMIGDRKEVLFGGSNIYDRRNRDYNVLASGPLVRDFMDLFAREWGRSGGDAGELHGATPAASAEIDPGGADTARMRLYACSPEENSVRPRILEMLSQAERSVDISMMVISGLAGEDFLRALSSARARGVRVRILTDARLFALNALAVRRLRRSGLEVKYYDGGEYFQLHGKLIVVDGTAVLVGSSNIDSFSFESNTEIMVELAGNAAIARIFRESFERDWAEN